MPYIVSLGAGEKGQLLLQQWHRTGNHRTGNGFAHLDDAAVILLDVGESDLDLAKLGPSLAGKIVIDCSTPSGISELQSGPSMSDEIARLCPGARVVKAFNVIDVAALEFVFKQTGPSIKGVYTSTYYCTDDEQAKQVVTGLIDEIGLDPIDCGPLANETLLDSLGVVTQYLLKTSLHHLSQSSSFANRLNVVHSTAGCDRRTLRKAPAAMGR